jgi:hypothetical protein
VLLTEDVEIILQHLTGVLQNVAKKQASKSSSPTYSATYGDKQVCHNKVKALVDKGPDPAQPLPEKHQAHQVETLESRLACSQQHIYFPQV